MNTVKENVIVTNESNFSFVRKAGEILEYHIENQLKADQESQDLIKEAIKELNDEIKQTNDKELKLELRKERTALLHLSAEYSKRDREFFLAVLGILAGVGLGAFAIWLKYGSKAVIH